MRRPHPLGRLLDPLAKPFRPLLDVVQKIHDCPVPLGDVIIRYTRMDAVKRAEALVPNLGKARIAHRFSHRCERQKVLKFVAQIAVFRSMLVKPSVEVGVDVGEDAREALRTGPV